MSDPTRFVFDGVEYGVVERIMKPWDYVVLPRGGFDHLRVVKYVGSDHFETDVDIEGVNGFMFERPHYIVEPLKDDSKTTLTENTKMILEKMQPKPKHYEFTDFIHPDSAELSSLIEDEADDFKNFLLDKNDRYGDSVLHTYRKYGQVSFDVRIEDKKNRLKYLLENDGDIEDTIKDLHGYMILNDACRKLENE